MLVQQITSKIHGLLKILNSLPERYIFYLLFAAILFFLSLIPPVWGYDEYASVVTHLELDDERFMSIYGEKLSQIGVTGFLSEAILFWLLPLIIVPVRWTYALGLSPIYEIARLGYLDWHIFRYILISIHITFAVLGYRLITKVLYERLKQKPILITSLILSSLPFLYWTLTLSPYSLHLFCFGLLMFFEQSEKEGFLSKKALARSLVMLLNYQYIFVVFFMGLIQVLRDLRMYRFKKVYRSWALPFLTALLSILFLFFRSSIFGVHSNPSQSVVNVVGGDLYNPRIHALSSLEYIKFTASRLCDIFLYYFETDNYHELLINRYSYLGITGSIVVYFILTYLIYFTFTFDKKYGYLISSFWMSTITLYFSGLYPMMPSRHALIMFLPAIVVLLEIINKLMKPKTSSIFGSVILLLAICNISLNYNIGSPPLDIDDFEKSLTDNNVERLFIDRCDLEPILHSKRLLKFNPLYRCGPFVVENIDINEYSRIAIYSKNKLTSGVATEIVNDYLVDEVTLDDLNVIANVNFLKDYPINLRVVDSVTHSLIIFDVQRHH
jgi:hypothetical protein